MNKNELCFRIKLKYTTATFFNTDPLGRKRYTSNNKELLEPTLCVSF